MARTLEQQIAALDAKIASLRYQSRKLETGQKIILGGMLINAARKEPNIRAWLLREAGRTINREADKRRLFSLIEELKEIEK